MSRPSIQAWRLVKSSRAETAFDGEGAFRFGGRWNSRGQRVVYASSTLVLALLEILVHVDPADHVPELVAIPIQIPEHLIEIGDYSTESTLAGVVSWPIQETRRAGDAWIQAAKKAALQIPSAVVPIEENYLLNPEHPDFQKIKFGSPETFPLDQPRLVS